MDLSRLLDRLCAVMLLKSLAGLVVGRSSVRVVAVVSATLKTGRQSPMKQASDGPRLGWDGAMDSTTSWTAILVVACP